MSKRQQADLNNRARQLNSQDPRFWESRGLQRPAPPPEPPRSSPPPAPPAPAQERGTK
jgi:hypothetical protein